MDFQTIDAAASIVAERTIVPMGARTFVTMVRGPSTIGNSTIIRSSRLERVAVGDELRARVTPVERRRGRAKKERKPPVVDRGNDDDKLPLGGGSLLRLIAVGESRCV